MRTLFIHFGIVCLLLPVAFAQTPPPPPAKVVRYAVTMIQRYDKDGNGILQREEWENMPGAPRAIDRDGDQQITQEEFVWYFAHYGWGRTIHRTTVRDLSEPYRFDPKTMHFFRPVSPRTDTPQVAGSEVQDTSDDAMEEMMKTNAQPIDDEFYQKLLEERLIPASRPYHVLPANLQGVPAWFIILDKNGDGQISLAEFTPTLAPAMVDHFKRYDNNGNGLIEPDEVRGTK